MGKTEAAVWANRVVSYDVKAPADLLPHPANYRRHPARQREALRGSLNELGVIAPVLVNRVTGHLLDGHARVEEYLAAGLAGIPVAYVEVPPDKEGLALLSLDPIAAMAEADKEALAALLSEVETTEEGLAALFRDLAADLDLGAGGGRRDDPGAQITRAAELAALWGTEPGQLWEVGQHRLLCGDATTRADVERLLGGAVPNLMITDPPYGVEYDPSWRTTATGPDGRLLSRGTHRQGAVSNDDRADWREAWALFPGDVAYVWHGGTHARAVAESIEVVGLEVRAQIIWVKQSIVIGRGHYHWRHEPCLYAVRKGRTASWAGDHKQSTVWEITNAAGNGEVDDSQTDHSTQKPVECMARPLRNHHGDVYDPFLGSGTTFVAAEQEGRVAYGLELDPGYVAVTLERLKGMGLRPKLLEPAVAAA